MLRRFVTSPVLLIVVALVAVVGRALADDLAGLRAVERTSIEYILAIELAIFLVECPLYAIILNRGLARAVKTSALANLASALVGFVVPSARVWEGRPFDPFGPMTYAYCIFITATLETAVLLRLNRDCRNTAWLVVGTLLVNAATVSLGLRLIEAYGNTLPVF